MVKAHMLNFFTVQSSNSQISDRETFRDEKVYDNEN
jgi:hypothetical protein